MSLNPLGIVREIVEGAGMAVSFAHDDLVFLDRNAFFPQFTAKDKGLFIHTNREAAETGVENAVARLRNIAAAHGMTFTGAGLNAITQADDANIRLEFFQSP